MESRPLLFLLAALAMNAQAATLAADSLVCESPADLEFASRQVELKGQPASVALKRAAASVQGYKAQGNSARLVSMPHQISAEQGKVDAQPYASLVGSCASSSGAAEVIERKPISGIVKVRTTYQGRPAELWTYAASLTE